MSRYIGIVGSYSGQTVDPCTRKMSKKELKRIEKILNEGIKGGRVKLMNDNPESNEWKELKIDCLPEDIFVGNYEFEYVRTIGWTPAKRFSHNKEILELIGLLSQKEFKYRYRRCQEKEPTHEELAEGYVWDVKPFVPSEIKVSYSLVSKYMRQIRDAFIAGLESK